MACAGGFRSVVEQGLLYLFLPAAPASAILSWSSAPHSRRGCRGARSQRTIKKSTKNKLRSAYPSPYRASTLPSLAQGELYSLPFRVLQPLGRVWARMRLSSILSFRLHLCPLAVSLSLSFFSSLSPLPVPPPLPRFSPPPRPRRRCRFSSLFFSWFVWGRSWRSRIRETGERGEK